MIPPMVAIPLVKDFYLSIIFSLNSQFSMLAFSLMGFNFLICFSWFTVGKLVKFYILMLVFIRTSF